jgi:hypothetical protein
MLALRMNIAKNEVGVIKGRSALNGLLRKIIYLNLGWL